MTPEDFPKAYEPQRVQDRIYQEWLEKGYWHANPRSNKPPFSIVMPPPNITGVLTLGHVLNNTLQDILCRRARMQGYEVLWLPGTDHAGLATQTAVEKNIKKTEGKTRFDFSREAFLEKVWEWQKKHGNIIIEQLKKLGCSCDWQRQRFTLDEAYTRAVQRVFITLYERGYIYRGLRMVNWCPASLTAISDEEVIPKAQKSTLYYIDYILEDDRDKLTVATTRPETIMADVAVAVHPHDERYKKYIGRNVRRPLAPALIPIIPDPAIDPKFGTGVLKVTPAHDKLDFEIGQRHNLPIIDILTPDGKVSCPQEPELDGLDRFIARKRAAEILQSRSLLSKEEPYENNVGFSERADVPIEPRLSWQWFLDYKKMANNKMIELALQVVRQRLIEFVPSHWEKVYAHWLENIQDWCISRQVWWGHRIPVWYAPEAPDPSHHEVPKHLIRCQIESPGEGWKQDPNTLDTWFSSWLWAFETMDEETRQKFYPTSVLVTGPDIIFLWVARMIIAGLEFKPGKV
ncbi:MAG: valine--tRNA ligase [Methylacidiphilales bacterium]|nr:valine--tRNA ligase [Candidatus Methylacidiphilales bacterium]MDW8348824.1 valine--tRNA ligase [Verrucomicrobiae bacterium]